MLRVWFVALLGLLASALIPVGSGTAAVTSYLCWGYDGCSKAGYSHAGYKAASGKMWWRMYSGHNCTNYVAYRLIKNGYSDQRPWTGSGNATNWGVAMKNLTDQTPTVGSVAWWKAGQGGTGSAGHVAYVEQVVSSTEIVVSQDSWGGDFSWRRITKSSGRWPTGFIHFTDRSISNKVAPTITGTPQVDQTLKVGGASWKNKPAAYARQWYSNGVAIPGANAATYVVPPEQAGKKLSATITASRSGFSSATASAQTATTVAKGEFADIGTPAIAGTAQLDEELQVVANKWAPTPHTTKVKWFADGKRIAGVTDPTLTLSEDLVDAVIHAKLVAKAPGYVKATATSTPTAPVTAGQVAFAGPTKIAGKPKVGNTLTATPAAAVPARATTSVEWLHEDGTVVGTGPTYVVQPSDVGELLNVRTTAALKSYRPVTATTPLAQTSFTKPSMSVTTKGKKKAAVVKVRVTAPGISTVPGVVTVRVGKTKISKVALVGGKVKIRVADLKAGKRNVRIRFHRSDSFRAVKTTSTVTIRGK